MAIKANSLSLSDIASYYLYGTKEAPEDYSARLRSDATLATYVGVSLQIDAVDFMANSAGRFANISQVPLVEMLFNSMDHQLEYDLLVNKYLQDGKTVSIKTLIDDKYISADSISTIVSQYEMGAGLSDYRERGYIWSTGKYRLNDDAEISLEGGYRPVISNVYLRPFDDDFDYVSSNPAVQVSNVYSMPKIDPYAIGRTVNFEFVDKDNIAKTSYYGREAFNNDLNRWDAERDGGYVSAITDIFLAGNTAIEESGILEYDLPDGGSVIYGSDADNVIDGTSGYYSTLLVKSLGQGVEVWTSTDDPTGLLSSHIATPGDNNTIIISGGGKDTLTTGAGDDKIFAGDGDDTIIGGNGSDFIDGGEGNDTIYAGTKAAAEDEEMAAEEKGNDIILAGAGDDVVYISGGSDIVSLGDGDDELHISSANDGEPVRAVIWGGAGADSFYFDKAAHVLAVNVDGITEEALKNLSVDAIFEYFNQTAGIENPYEYILINVEETDKIFLEGTKITGSSSIGKEDFRHAEEFDFRDLMILKARGYFPSSDEDYFPAVTNSDTAYPGDHDFFHWEEQPDTVPYNFEDFDEDWEEGDVGYPSLFMYGVYPDAWKVFLPTAVRDIVMDWYTRYFEANGSGEHIYVDGGAYGAAVSLADDDGLFFRLDGFVDGWAGITFVGNDSTTHTDVTLTTQDIDTKNPETHEDTVDHFIYQNPDVNLFIPDSPGFDPSLPRYGHRFDVPTEYHLVGDPVVMEKTVESDDMLKPDSYGSAYTPTVNLAAFRRGTPGDDALSGSSESQSFNGGEGSDSVDYSASTGGISVDLSAGVGFGGDAEGDKFVSIENLTGTAFDDFLTGNDGANILIGNGGDDGLLGGDGDDRLFGGDGNDWIDGGAGNDIIDGGAGDLDEVDYNGSLQEYSFTRNADNSVTVVSERGGTDTLFNIEYMWLFSEDWSSHEVFSLADLAPHLPEDNAEGVITGTVGDDHLVGTTGNDVIDSLGGNDYVNGGEGRDTYLYSVNDGDEYIDDEAGSMTDVDVLRMKDINYADATFSHDSSSSNLVLTVNSTSHVITLDEQYYSSSEGWGLEKVEFADGITVDLKHSDEVWSYQGSSGDDHITGAIWGKQDIFEGGHGNDVLSGEAGSDSYVYSKGDGSDLIYDNAGFTVDQGNTDVLQFTDLNQSDLTFSRNGDDLEISVNDTGETITVDRQFQSTEQDWGVEKIEFADGSSWDLQDIWDETAPAASANNVIALNSAASATASQADTSAELVSADIIAFPTASIAVDSSDDGSLANDDIIITEAEDTDSSTYSADIISLEDFVANQQNEDQNSDLWFEPEPIGALI